MPAFTSHIIKTSLARQLIKNYDTHKKPRLEQGMPFVGGQPFRETQVIWFPLNEELANWLGLAYQVTDPSISGVRIYLAAYETSSADTNGIPHNPDYNNKMTVVLSTTWLNPATNQHEDIIPPDEVNDAPAYENYASLLAFDDGQICPPPNCPPGLPAS